MGGGWLLDVEYKGGMVKYAAWPLLSQYSFQLAQRAWKLCGQYTMDSVLEYTRAVEEDFRAKAIELARGSEQQPWGHALAHVIKEHSSIWKDHDHVLHRAGRSSAPGVMLLPASSPPPPPVEPVASRSKWQTANYTASGQKICKKNNDRRGCEAKCPKGEVHCCDIVIASSGKVCEGRDHNRETHDPVKHGKPAVR